MRIKLKAFIWTVLLLVALSSATSARKVKSKSTDQEKRKSVVGNTSTDYTSDEDSVQPVASRLIKKSENLTETNEGVGQKKSYGKEDSPAQAESGEEEGVDDDIRVDELSKIDLARESRGNKNPRIYYDDTSPRYQSNQHSHHHHHHLRESELGGSNSEGKSQGQGKFYFPKNYGNSKQGSKPSQYDLPGKREPDHVGFDFGSGHQHIVDYTAYPVTHGHSNPVVDHGHGMHHNYEHHPKVEQSGKTQNHVSVYGGYHHNHHHGSYRHTLGDKVDAVGKALKVLVPSALLLTGVSAIFPNRVHVPTNPIPNNKFRQKRSAYGPRRVHRHRARFIAAHPSAQLIEETISPEYQDIPTHALEAEHRIMDDTGIAIYPETSHTQEVSAHPSVNTGFNPFNVFNGPGAENTAQYNIENSYGGPMPGFPELPELPTYSDNNGYSQSGINPEIPTDGTNVPVGIDDAAYITYAPTFNTDLEIVPTEMSRHKDVVRSKPIKMQRVSIRPAKVPGNIQSQKRDHVVAHPGGKEESAVKEGEQFMASIQNLVTPDVAKAIVANKQQEPPTKVDLSPDGPVMGLLNSYAQHEKESPSCQKRALCELAVKGKNPNATKFEAFLWSVATMVPDVFSKMYDLQEVFQAIRDEGCARFKCTNPNLDIQLS